MLLFNNIEQIISSYSLDNIKPYSFAERIIFDNYCGEVFLHKYLSEALKINGFCIFKADTTHSVSKLIQLLNFILGEPLAQNKNGLTRVLVQPIKEQRKYINTNTFQPIHTDNGYDHLSPDIVVMHCLKMAKEGGQSLIVTINSLLEYLNKLFKDHLNLLYDVDAVTYIKANKTVTKSILYRDKFGNDNIDFSVFADAIDFKSQMLEDIFLSIVKFVHCPSNQLEMLLTNNEVLIIDNRTVLHGRKAFVGDRTIERIWYNGNLL